MKIFGIILLFLSVLFTKSQSVCSVSCSKQGCLSSNPLLCTKCDPGTILINQRCAIAGSQSEPLSIIIQNQNSQNNLTVGSGIQPQNSNWKQIECQSASPGQTGKIRFLNITKSKQQVYSFRTPEISINSPHQFINIKFNAILFNQKANPSFRVLVIDDADQRIYDNVVNSNEPAFTCLIDSISRPASNGFYVVISLSTSSKTFLFQISTLQVGDELGLSDFQIFYGNCETGCSKCEGPGSTQCLQCTNLLSYNQVQKQCQNCPSRFYRINSICYPCPYNCESCELNQSLGVPVCTKCEKSIIPNGKVPECSNPIYVNQNFKALRFNDSFNWESTSILSGLATVCGAYSLLGGLPSGLGGSSLFKTFQDLPVHSQIWIKFTLFLIDQVAGSDYKTFVDVDGIRALNYTTNIDSNIMKTSECGTERQQFISTVIISNISHSGSKARISIVGLNNYFGIRDFALGVINATNEPNCEQVNAQNQCVRCKNGLAVFSNTQPGICAACPEGFYITNGLCKICPIYCKTCLPSTGSVLCSSCDGPLKYDEKSNTCNDLSNSLYTVALSQHWQNETNQNWEIYPKLQNKGSDFCGPYSILGSTQIRYRQLSMKRLFSQLPNHQGVSIHFYFYQIDNYDNGNQVSFKLGDKTIPYVPLKQGYQICGNSSFDSISKIILNDTVHQAQSLTLEIVGKAKFGVSNVALFLTNCQDCKNKGISYEVELMPVYSVQTESQFYDRGLLTKITFPEKVRSNTELKKLFQIRLQNLTDGTQVAQTLPDNNNSNRGKGERDPYEVLTAQLYANRQLKLLQNLIKDQYGKYSITRLLAPDLVYGFAKLANGETLIKNLRLSPVISQFSRYDNLHLDSNGGVYRADTRNLMNLFRGIAILALFIGVISFLFGLSDLFDDLFVMCQIIFVHVFIQSSWLAPTMKLPVGAMNLVQFMSWLPIQARTGIEKAIIPPDHYQRSPLVYQQYWKDTSFARAIYHVVIFLVAMLILYWVIRLIKSLRSPSIDNVNNITRQKYRFIENFYYDHAKNWFVYIDRIMRFTFFTVIWAAGLQFIYFFVEPSGFMGWNSALCIVMFVAYIVYAILGFLYLRNQASFTNQTTFKDKFDGIRIKKKSLWYFLFKYGKWLAIALIVGLLYKVNPLATLIPLIVIHLLDLIILIVRNPYIEDSGESEMIVSKCTKKYWTYYRISHIIENGLFIVLEIILIIMYATRTTANKSSYMSTGYACCAFIIMMFINGLVRLVWGFIRQFEKCYEQIRSRDQEIKTEEDIDPLKFQDLYRANVNNDGLTSNNRGGARRPSIQYGY